MVPLPHTARPGLPRLEASEGKLRARDGAFFQTTHEVGGLTPLPKGVEQRALDGGHGLAPGPVDEICHVPDAYQLAVLPLLHHLPDGRRLTLHPSPPRSRAERTRRAGRSSPPPTPPRSTSRGARCA